MLEKIRNMDRISKIRVLIISCLLILVLVISLIIFGNDSESNVEVRDEVAVSNRTVTEKNLPPYKDFIVPPTDEEINSLLKDTRDGIKGEGSYINVQLESISEAKALSDFLNEEVFSKFVINMEGQIIRLHSDDEPFNKDRDIGIYTDATNGQTLVHVDDFTLEEINENGFWFLYHLILSDVVKEDYKYKNEGAHVDSIEEAAGDEGNYSLYAKRGEGEPLATYGVTIKDSVIYVLQLGEEVK